MEDKPVEVSCMYMYVFETCMYMYACTAVPVLKILFVISVAMNSPGKASSFGATGTHFGGGIFRNTLNNLAMKPHDDVNGLMM